MLYDSVYHRCVRYPCDRHPCEIHALGSIFTHVYRRASIVTPLYIYTMYYTPYIFEDGLCIWVFAYVLWPVQTTRCRTGPRASKWGTLRVMYNEVNKYYIHTYTHIEWFEKFCSLRKYINIIIIILHVLLFTFTFIPYWYPRLSIINYK